MGEKPLLWIPMSVTGARQGQTWKRKAQGPKVDVSLCWGQGSTAAEDGYHHVHKSFASVVEEVKKDFKSRLFLPGLFLHHVHS